MTYFAGAFTSYQPCPSSKKITVADGSLNIVAGQGTIPLNPVFTLKRVLHVPNLTANLLSIQKLIKDINCSVTFFLDHCIFQDLAAGRMIGQARVKRMGCTCLECKAAIVTPLLYHSFQLILIKLMFGIIIVV
jgi:hypothetical protein